MAAVKSIDQLTLTENFQHTVLSLVSKLIVLHLSNVLNCILL